MFIRPCHWDTMPEDKHCKLLQPSKAFEQRKKKKKKSKKNLTSTTAEGSAEKPQAALLPLTSQNPPQSLQPLTSSEQSLQHRRKTIQDESLGVQLSASHRAAENSLRWEGVLQDPQAEEERLEQYRANRRRRYIAHREALIKETREGLRQTLSNECREAKASTKILH